MRSIIAVFIFVCASLCHSELIQAADGPKKTTSVDQVIDFVSHPQHARGGMMSGDIQMRYRMWGLNYLAHPYVFKEEDVPAWRKLLNDEEASIYGRMCAAIFISEHDEKAREFLKKHAVSENLRHRNNALFALCYTLRDESGWSLDYVLKIIDSGLLDQRPKTQWKSYKEAEKFPEGDLNDGTSHMLFDVCNQLRFVKSPKSVPVMMRLIERTGGPDSAVWVLTAVKDQRAAPLLFELYKQNPTDETYISAMGSFKIKEAVPLLLENLEKLAATKSESDRQWGDGWAYWGALEELKDPRAVPVIKKLLTFDTLHPKFAADARLVLIQLDSKDVVADLIKEFKKNTDESHGGDIIYVFGDYPSQASIDFLAQEAANGKYAFWRRNAIWTLGHIKNRKALLALSALLDVNHPADLPGEYGWKGRPDFSKYFPDQIMRTLSQATDQDFGSSRAMWEEWIKANVKE